MQLAAEFGTGQVLWSIIWFFLFFIWIMLIFQVFGDIFRSHNSGVSKALWTIGIIFLPYLGVFLYLIVHGSGMAQRQAQSMQKNDCLLYTSQRHQRDGQQREPETGGGVERGTQPDAEDQHHKPGGAGHGLTCLLYTSRCV